MSCEVSIEMAMETLRWMEYQKTRSGWWMVRNDGENVRGVFRVGRSEQFDISITLKQGVPSALAGLIGGWN